jgi:hypothetical protein
MPSPLTNPEYFRLKLIATLVHGSHIVAVWRCDVTNQLLWGEDVSILDRHFEGWNHIDLERIGTDNYKDVINAACSLGCGQSRVKEFVLKCTESIEDYKDCTEDSKALILSMIGEDDGN